MSTIAVTGAEGYVGRYAIRALLEAGHRIVALVRKPEDAEAVRRRVPTDRRGAIETRLADVTKPETLPAALAGVDAVLHLAAIPRDLDGGRSLHRVNTQGTANVVDAARAAGIRRFVHQGALGVADDPELHYASSKAKAEALVRGSGLDWTITKPSLLFGPGDGFFNIVADLVRMSPGVVPLTGSGGSRFQPLAVDDLARVFVQVFEDQATVGRSYELGGPAYWTYREITEEVLRALGKRRLLLPMPVVLIKLVAGTAERLHVPFPVATDQLRQLKLDNVGDLDAVRAAFGFAPRSMSGALGYLRRKKRDQDLPATG